MSTWAIATHTFKPGQGPAYWEAVGKLMENDPDLSKWHASNQARGFHCHASMPSKAAKNGDDGSRIHCIWELQKGKTLLELQHHIDELELIGSLMQTFLSDLDTDSVPMKASFEQ